MKNIIWMSFLFLLSLACKKETATDLDSVVYYTLTVEYEDLNCCGGWAVSFQENVSAVTNMEDKRYKVINLDKAYQITGTVLNVQFELGKNVVLSCNNSCVSNLSLISFTEIE